MVVDTSWIFGYIAMGCFSLIAIAVTIKAIGFLFPKKEKKEKNKVEEGE